MNIILTHASDPAVTALFSEYDDFIIDFLGDDRVYYTRYTPGENIECVWLALSDGAPAGCVGFRRRDAETGEVKRLFVKKEYRGRGISKALLSAVEDHARLQGCSALFLDTRITLEPAVSLYRKTGFAEIFRQGLYVQMKKPL